MTRSIDHRSERNNKRFLPYLSPVKQHHSSPKPTKKRRHSNKTRMETHVRRYEENEAVTVLSIRFASSDVTEGNEKE